MGGTQVGNQIIRQADVAFITWVTGDALVFTPGHGARPTLTPLNMQLVLCSVPAVCVGTTAVLRLSLCC